MDQITDSTDVTLPKPSTRAKQDDIPNFQLLPDSPPHPAFPNHNDITSAPSDTQARQHPNVDQSCTVKSREELQLHLKLIT